MSKSYCNFFASASRRHTEDSLMGLNKIRLDEKKDSYQTKSIDCLFDRTEDYQARIGKIHEEKGI